MDPLSPVPPSDFKQPPQLPYVPQGGVQSIWGYDWRELDSAKEGQNLAQAKQKAKEVAAGGFDLVEKILALARKVSAQLKELFNFKRTESADPGIQKVTRVAAISRVHGGGAGPSGESLVDLIAKPPKPKAAQALPYPELREAVEWMERNRGSSPLAVALRSNIPQAELNLIFGQKNSQFLVEWQTARDADEGDYEEQVKLLDQLGPDNLQALKETLLAELPESERQEASRELEKLVAIEDAAPAQAEELVDCLHRRLEQYVRARLKRRVELQNPQPEHAIWGARPKHLTQEEFDKLSDAKKRELREKEAVHGLMHGMVIDPWWQYLVGEDTTPERIEGVVSTVIGRLDAQRQAAATASQELQETSRALAKHPEYSALDEVYRLSQREQEGIFGEQNAQFLRHWEDAQADDVDEEGYAQRTALLNRLTIEQRQALQEAILAELSSKKEQQKLKEALNYFARFDLASTAEQESMINELGPALEKYARARMLRAPQLIREQFAAKLGNGVLAGTSDWLKLCHGSQQSWEKTLQKNPHLKDTPQLRELFLYIDAHSHADRNWSPAVLPPDEYCKLYGEMMDGFVADYERIKLDPQCNKSKAGIVRALHHGNQFNAQDFLRAYEAYAAEMQKANKPLPPEILLQMEELKQDAWFTVEMAYSKIEAKIKECERNVKICAGQKKEKEVAKWRAEAQRWRVFIENLSATCVRDLDAHLQSYKQARADWQGRLEENPYGLVVELASQNRLYPPILEGTLRERVGVLQKNWMMAALKPAIGSLCKQLLRPEDGVQGFSEEMVVNIVTGIIAMVTQNFTGRNFILESIGAGLGIQPPPPTVTVPLPELSEAHFSAEELAAAEAQPATMPPPAVSTSAKATAAAATPSASFAADYQASYTSTIKELTETVLQVGGGLSKAGYGGMLNLAKEFGFIDSALGTYVNPLLHGALMVTSDENVVAEACRAYTNLMFDYDPATGDYRAKPYTVGMERQDPAMQKFREQLPQLIREQAKAKATAALSSGAASWVPGLRANAERLAENIAGNLTDYAANQHLLHQFAMRLVQEQVLKNFFPNLTYPTPQQIKTDFYKALDARARKDLQLPPPPI